jgi:hypothetical protein
VCTRRSLIFVYGYEQDIVKCNCLFHTTPCTQIFELSVLTITQIYILDPNTGYILSSFCLITKRNMNCYNIMPVWGFPLKFMEDNLALMYFFLAEFLRGSSANRHSTIARYFSITAPEACNSPKKALRYHKGCVNSSI